jgi:hypothetical protein
MPGILSEGSAQGRGPKGAAGARRAACIGRTQRHGLGLGPAGLRGISAS